MTIMSSSPPPPLHIGDHHPPPLQVHCATTNIQNCHLPRRQHPKHLSEKINNLCQSKNLTGALTLLRDSHPEHTETAKAICTLLQACGGDKDIKTGRKLHHLVSSSPHLKNNSILTTQIITMYSDCKSPADSKKFFEELEKKSLNQWNAIISGFTRNNLWHDAIIIFSKLLVTNLTPDNFTLPCVIKACAVAFNLRCGMAIHGVAVKRGLHHDVFVGNSLITMYGKFGFVEDAYKVFDEMPERNLVTWNSLISVYSHSQKSIDLFIDFDLIPDVATLVTILPICGARREVSLGKTIHTLAIKLGLYHDLKVQNALIDLYMKIGYAIEAQMVFDRIKNKNVVSWNTIINGYMQNGEPLKAIDSYREMKSLGFEPDLYTISSLLLACGELKLLNHGKEIHGFVVKNGFESDTHISNTLISFYIHSNKYSSAKTVFDQLKNKNLVSWNSIVTAKQPHEAINLFAKMLTNGIEPNEIATTSVLCACARLSALNQGKTIHCFALKKNLTTDVIVNSSIIDMYAKSGSVKSARNVFDKLDKKNVGIWTVMISGYAIHGQGKEAVKLFHEMERCEMKPDHFTFIAILTACKHGGLVKEGIKFYNEMKTIYKVEPKIEHYACLIDMLGRVGRFDDAINFIAKMDEKPDARIWSSLLSSCRIHGNMELGKIVSEKLLKLEPNKAENYVMTSNLFASSGNWNEVGLIREKMKRIGVKKEAGCSWIDVEGRVYKFFSGDSEGQEL